MIILGDFNKNWLERVSLKDNNLFSSINLMQIITEPTRVDRKFSTILDWILVTHPDRIIKSGVLPDSLSHHSIIFCVWKTKVPRLPPKCIKVRKIKNINVEQFIEDVCAIKWDRLQLIPFVNDAWD